MAESYVERDNRGAFHNAGEFSRLYPEDDRPSSAYSAPLIEEEGLAGLRERLWRRAQALGCAVAEDPDRHLLVDGRRVDPERVDGTRHRFALSGRPGEIGFTSRTTRPFDSGKNRERRRLGISARGITLHRFRRARPRRGLLRRRADPSLDRRQRLVAARPARPVHRRFHPRN